MANITVFFGFLVTPTFEKVASRTLLRALTQGDLYLEEICTGPYRFLGKFTSQTPSFGELEMLETHITSLLKKIAPSHHFPKDCLVLIPYGERRIFHS